MADIDYEKQLSDALSNYTSTMEGFQTNYSKLLEQMSGATGQQAAAYQTTLDKQKAEDIANLRGIYEQSGLPNAGQMFKTIGTSIQPEYANKAAQYYADLTAQNLQTQMGGITQQMGMAQNIYGVTTDYATQLKNWQTTEKQQAIEEKNTYDTRVDGWTKYYLDKGFSPEEAAKKAKDYIGIDTAPPSDPTAPPDDSTPPATPVAALPTEWNGDNVNNYSGRDVAYSLVTQINNKQIPEYTYKQMTDAQIWAEVQDTYNGTVNSWQDVRDIAVGKITYGMNGSDPEAISDANETLVGTDGKLPYYQGIWDKMDSNLQTKKQELDDLTAAVAAHENRKTMFPPGVPDPNRPIYDQFKKILAQRKTEYETLKGTADRLDHYVNLLSGRADIIRKFMVGSYYDKKTIKDALSLSSEIAIGFIPKEYL